MRYLDWDVLLFPDNNIQTERNHIPLKEFRTTCYALSDGFQAGGVAQRSTSQRPPGITPLLNCFVPSLPRGSIFYLSVHCWSLASLQFPTIAESGSNAARVWQVRVIIDGQCVTCEVMQLEGPWPYAIHLANTGLCDQNQHLRFPAFNKATATSRAFNAADSLGRVKVEIAAGIFRQHAGVTTFDTVSKLVCFSFVHAPMDHLERCGLAWPNPAMFNNPIHSSSLLDGSPSASSEHTSSIGGYRGLDLSSPARCMPPPPTPTSLLTSPYNGYTTDDTSNYDVVSSRDSSYLYIRGSSLNQTLMQANRMPDLSNDLPELSRQPKEEPHTTTPTFTSINAQLGRAKDMPPPPLPSRIFTASTSESFLPVMTDRSSDQALTNRLNQRDQSRGSDISMHVGCTAFPACTSEDQHGLIKHESPPAPATAIRGKKSTHDHIPTTSTAQPSSPLSDLDDVMTAAIPTIEKTVKQPPSSPTDLPTTGKKRRGSTLHTAPGRNGSQTKVVIKLARTRSKTTANDDDKENLLPDMSIDELH